MESQERSGWVMRKPYAPAFGFKNTHLLPQQGKKCSVPGFALLSCGEEPCPLRLQTVFSTHKPSQSLGTDFAGQSLRVFDVLILIYGTSCYHGFGDASMGTLPITYSLENIKIP
jgi:hypothetical protein